MDLFVASSRGKYLASHFNQGARAVFWFKKGAMLSQLYSKAKTLLAQNRHLYQDVQHIHPNFVYVIGGLPDITSVIEDDHYQEIIYTEDTTETYNRLCTTYTKISQDIINLNAIPCFATITPMHLEDWNNYRLSIGATSYLIHHRYYEDMTHLLNQAIININNFIRDLNESNNVDTPKFASCFIKKRGQGRENRIMYNRLDDGCHATEEIIEKWKLELELITSSNRYRNATDAVLMDANRNHYH